MANFDNLSRENFGSRIGVIAAAAGSAIGLGNIWRFPYVAGENGGGAFLLIYIGFIILIGAPVMLSEFVIGRKSQRNPVGAFRVLAPKTKWPLVGYIGIAAAFTILAFYTTVAGWTLEYLYLSIVNGFSGQNKSELQNLFGEFAASGYSPLIWQLVFMLLTALIVFKGVKDGIEKYTKILMPLLLIIIIGLCIRSLTLPGASEGLIFLFKPDFSKINGNVVLQALGQSFFSLSIGMGTLITYGSYISKKDNLGSTAVSVSIADTLIAILAGVAIFPAVFAFGIAPEAGPGLVFITLPMIFSQITGGQFFEIIFFILLVIAALTSTISVLEVVVAYLTEELNMSRKKATILASGSIAVLGLFCTLSMGPMPELSIAGMNLFDILEKTSANIFLPLGGLFIVLFVGWKLSKEQVIDEISNNNLLKVRFKYVFLFIVRFIAPIAISLVFLNGLGLFNAFGGGDL
ncbi:MAG: sodium-dependent transporter [Bacteroidetes bacterium HGW-Bacteroidetes-1]|jgi:NSS family neurotransmitter:Na+ symporter|nr:MAG: sodium-dependent transporter [Bacteroidetes bacterium HGW-Bacteroidetes-1]